MTQFYYPEVIPDIPENEKWVDNFYGYYTIRADGKVFSYHRKRKELKQQWMKKHSRLYVNLSVANDLVKVYVHVLVANSFLPNPHGCSHIMFKDFNPYNVNVNNLEWVSDYVLTILPEGMEWIPDYEGWYYTDSELTLYNRYGNVISPTIVGNYKQYDLYKNGKGTKVYFRIKEKK